MKKLITILLLTSLIACENSSNVNRQSTGIQLNYFGGYELEIVVLDSCQYYYRGSGESALLTHKGNCNNPIHPENKRK